MRKICIVKLMLIENILSFIELLKNKMWQNWQKSYIWQLMIFLLFLFPCLWSAPPSVSDSFPFQSGEALLAFDLPLALPQGSPLGAPQPPHHHTPSILGTGVSLNFAGFDDSLRRSPASTFHPSLCENLSLLEPVDGPVGSIRSEDALQRGGISILTSAWCQLLFYLDGKLFLPFRLLSLKQGAMEQKWYFLQSRANTSENGLLGFTRLFIFLPLCLQLDFLHDSKWCFLTVALYACDEPLPARRRAVCSSPALPPSLPLCLTEADVLELLLYILMKTKQAWNRELPHFLLCGAFPIWFHCWDPSKLPGHLTCPFFNFSKIP